MNGTKTYSRPRPFIAVTKDNRLELLNCSTNQPAKKYITRMIGPFKTLRGAIFYAANPMARSINQVEKMAKELRLVK